MGYCLKIKLSYLILLIKQSYVTQDNNCTHINTLKCTRIRGNHVIFRIFRGNMPPDPLVIYFPEQNETRFEGQNMGWIKYMLPPPPPLMSKHEGTHSPGIYALGVDSPYRNNLYIMM